MRSVRNAVLNPNTTEQIEIVLKRDMPIGRVAMFFTGLLSLLASYEAARGRYARLGPKCVLADLGERSLDQSGWCVHLVEFNVLLSCI